MPLRRSIVPLARTGAVSIGCTLQAMNTSSMEASENNRLNPTAGTSIVGAMELRASVMCCATALMVPSMTS